MKETNDDAANSDPYWWDYKIDWKNKDGEREPKEKSKEETLAKLMRFANLNGFMKDDPNRYFPSYREYIRPNEIISLQDPLSTNPEERVFIIVHQMYELVFKQMIFDFDVVAQSLSALLNHSEFEELISEKIPRDYEEFNHLKSQFELLNQDIVFKESDTEKEKRKKNEIKEKQAAIRRTLFWQAAFFASNRLLVSVEKMLNVLSYYLDITAFSGLQFAQFRPLLLPASGFQTEQFRTIQKILGKTKCYNPKIFGAHEFFKKYKNDKDAWTRTAKQGREIAEKFFVSIIDDSIYDKGAPQSRNWKNSKIEYAFELCKNVLEVLKKIGESVTDEMINSDASQYSHYNRFKSRDFEKQEKTEQEIRNMKIKAFFEYSNQFLDNADPLMPSIIEEKDYENWKSNIEDVRKYVESEIKTSSVSSDVEDHHKLHFDKEARKGMQKIAGEHRDSFLLHILRNLSLVDVNIHAIDYSKSNREHVLRSSVMKRPFFSFLERHLDFIDNQINIVMEYEGGGAIAGSGGGGKNYLEFAMRLYELFPAFPAVDEHIVK